MRTRAVLLGVVAAVIMMAVTAVMLEASLHTYFYFKNGYWHFLGREGTKVPYVKLVHDRRQFTLRENTKFEVYSINADGFRGPLLSKDDTRPIICALGDSVPFGNAVGDDETWPYHLQKILDDTGYRYRVLNAGVPSYNLRQSIDFWRINVHPKYKCAVATVQAANDVSLMHYYGSQWTPEITWADVRFNISGARYSSIVYYGSQAIDRIKARFFSGKQNDPFKLLAQDFRIQIGQLQSAGVPVVLMPMNPCYYHNEPIRSPRNALPCQGFRRYVDIAEAWHEKIDQLNKLLADAAAAPGVNFLDVITPFDNVLGREGKYIDFGHYSNNGNRELAKVIADFLIQQGLIKK